MLQVLVSLLLRFLAGAVVLSDENPFVHFFDGIWGIALGAAICTVAIAALMLILLVLEAKGLYFAGEMLFAGTDLFSVCYDSASKLLAPIVEQIVSVLPF